MHGVLTGVFSVKPPPPGGHVEPLPEWMNLLLLALGGIIIVLLTLWLFWRFNKNRRLLNWAYQNMSNPKTSTRVLTYVFVVVVFPIAYLLWLFYWASLIGPVVWSIRRWRLRQTFVSGALDPRGTQSHTEYQGSVRHDQAVMVTTQPKRRPSAAGRELRTQMTVISHVPESQLRAAKDYWESGYIQDPFGYDYEADSIDQDSVAVIKVTAKKGHTVVARITVSSGGAYIMNIVTSQRKK